LAWWPRRNLSGGGYHLHVQIESTWRGIDTGTWTVVVVKVRATGE
jgi:hypothetical protein